MRWREKTAERPPQLSYSELQSKTHDEERRRRKASKIVRVVQDFLGTGDLRGKVALDIGCSTGFTCEALHHSGATVIGLDIDVPGLRHARARFGDFAWFICADGSRLPLPDRGVDIVVFNHIYEHVVDPDTVMSEIGRVLKSDGLVYLGLGNRWQIVEPHYRLPFLSWLPRPAADRYVALSRRAPTYYEQFRSRRQLISMCTGLNLWDYTFTVLVNSREFDARDVVPWGLARLPARLWRGLAPIMPTFVWVGTPGTRTPSTAVRLEPPARVSAAT